MVVIAYDEFNVKDVVANAMATCHKLLGEFNTFFKEEPVVNFSVPNRIGIGVARGPATRLEAEGKILDYSGNTLNLAARLMDLARPTGVVLDSSVSMELIPKEVGKHFTKIYPVFLRGVAESEPVTIYCNQLLTKIPESCRHPLDAKWNVLDNKVKVSALKKVFGMHVTVYFLKLPSEPIDPKGISVELRWAVGVPKGIPKGASKEERVFSMSFHSFDYQPQGAEPVISLNLVKLMKLLDEQEELSDASTVTIRARYLSVQKEK